MDNQSGQKVVTAFRYYAFYLNPEIRESFFCP